jgi:hypothetical protein
MRTMWKLMNKRAAMAIEKSKCEVVEIDGKLELRQYALHIVAETKVQSSTVHFYLINLTQTPINEYTASFFWKKEK